MGLHFVVRENIIIVHGDTYRHRDEIKALGGRFDGKYKTWQIPLSDEALERVQALSGQNTQTVAPATTGQATREEAPSPADAGIPIRELVSAVARSVAAGFPGPVWVTGEIENITIKPQGIFLNLAEPKSPDGAAGPARSGGNGGGGGGGSISVKATIWPNALEYMRRMHGEDALRQVFQDGTQVRCLCRVGFYRDRAQLSLTIENVDPLFTKGALALAREMLMKELRAKGLDRANKMLPMPVFPFLVGLVSSEGSRAESDFLHQLESGLFPGKVIFMHAATQGEKVPVEVPAAIGTLARAGCDVIVLTRGGGSAADLRWFDAPEVAYAIAGCPVPVVAAIGHHDDTCVAEEICHMRQKTPTAAAQFIVDTIALARTRIDNAATGLKNSIDRMAEVQSRWFEGLVAQLISAANRVIMDHANALASIETRLTSLDPKPWLERGWTRLSVGGETIDSVRRLRKGMHVHARLKDGPVTLVVHEFDEETWAGTGKP
jgi:exodeoxyribonuclease VII large subunit